MLSRAFPQGGQAAPTGHPPRPTNASDGDLQEEDMWGDQLDGKRDDEDRTTRQATEGGGASDAGDVAGALEGGSRGGSLSDTERRAGGAPHPMALAARGGSLEIPHQAPRHGAGVDIANFPAIDEDGELDGVAMGTSMPIQIPGMVRATTSQRAIAVPRGGDDDPEAGAGAARMAVTFVPPHMMGRKVDGFSMVSLDGVSPAANLKRDLFKRRTAIMRATGFLEDKATLQAHKHASASRDATPVGSFQVVGSLAGALEQDVARAGFGGGLSKALGSSLGSDL